MMTPRLNLDFTSATLDSRITFTRTGNTATRINASGLIESVLANVPRFDYEPITGVCRGLLIEEQRVNLLSRSAEFDNAFWGTTNLQAFGSGSIANATTAPDGTSAADLIVESAVNGDHSVNRSGFSVTSGIPYTLSISAKANTRSHLNLRINDNNSNANAASVLVNLSDGSVAGVATAYGSFTSVSATVTAEANGFYRVSLSFTPSVSTVNPKFEISNGGARTADGRAVYLGNGTSGIYIWGAQLEAGAFPTSYIPTTTTAVTRNADVATITGTAFSGFWRSGPGSILVRALPSTVSGTRPLVQVDDATADNIIALRGNTTNPELYIRAGGSDQATIDAGTISAAAYRLAGAWQAGSAAAALNSGLAVNGAPASIPAVTQMRLGSDGTNYLNGHLQAVEYYDERVSDAGLRMLASTAGRRSMLRPIINRII